MKLKKELNLFDVFCMASGAMISSGLFVLPGLAHAQAGPAVIISYFLAGLLALTGMLSQAELVSAMPKAGGTYFYVTRSMGPALGTVDGMITWFSLSLKSAFALVGMAAFVKIAADIDIRLIAVPLCVLFVAVNILGIKGAVIVQRALVLGLLGILLYYVVRGIPVVQVQHFESFAPNGVAAIFSTAGLVFISFGGLLKIAAIAEEVKNPAQTVPRGMILSLFVVSIVYMLVIFVTSGVLEASKLDNSLTPISDGASVFMGNTGVLLLGIAAILAFISTANAGIMSASRYPMALSRDKLVPAFLGDINRRFRTPHVSLVITGLFMVLALFMEFGLLIKVASSVLILTFLFSCLSVIIMRESHLQNYQPPFRSPLYPWVQLIGIGGCLFLIFEMGVAALLASFVLIGSGLFVYWFYGRIRATREYALLHLVERITSKDLTAHLLETELKEIIRERDDISRDRFDHLVENCVVLDIDKRMELDEFFGEIANAMSGRLKTDSSVLLKCLQDRQKSKSVRGG